MSIKELHAAEVSARLELGNDFGPWLEELEQIGPPPLPVNLPDKHTVGDVLTRLGVSSDDAAEIIDAWLTPEHTPELWWLLERSHQQLVTQMGKPASLIPWQPLPQHLGAPGRLFYIYVCLATLAAVRQWHQERGIPDDISWTTLADLGEHIAIHRRMFGNAGLNSSRWLMLHFRGMIYRLGRLQFERAQLPARFNDAISDDIPGPRPLPDAPALSIHIPESGGPLDPVACTESIAFAREFFASYFPEENYLFGYCASWLLDPQLADYLPATSNIVRFQRLFHLIPEEWRGGDKGRGGDDNVMLFVFRRISPSLDELPQRTTLERAAVEHIRKGKHWQFRSGWLAL